jgi:hypothetical protein
MTRKKATASSRESNRDRLIAEHILEILQSAERHQNQIETVRNSMRIHLQQQQAEREHAASMLENTRIAALDTTDANVQSG